MDAVKIYRGGKSLPETNDNSIYFTSDGKLFSGHSQKYIGENLGIDNTNDAWGCYWKSIDFTNKTITLSSTQPVGSDDKYNSSYGVAVPVPADWAVDDRISIVNDDRYDVCCTIESISGNTITVSSLPFSSLKDPVVAGYTLEIDDYMILNVDKNTGPVKLNETAIVGGTGSKALGNASYAMGWECVSYGKSATTFGIGTEAGFAAFATGKFNKSIGLHSFTQGLENQATQTGSSAFGRRNISGARDTFVTGENNITYASTSAVFGKDNHIESDGARTIVFGNMNQEITGQNSLVGGYNNTLSGDNSLIVGSTNNSTGSYNIVAGVSNTVSTFKDANNNDVTPDSMAVFGQGHTIAGKHGLVSGYLNTATDGKSCFTALGRNITIGANNTHAIGRNLTTKTTEGQVVLGKYNDESTTGGKILVVGSGNQDSNGNITYLNAFTVTTSGTGSFANNCYAKNFYENNVLLSSKYAAKSHNHSAFGSGHTVTGDYGFTVGRENTITGQEGFAAGNNNTVNLKTTFALGYGLTTAASTAYGQVVVGKYNAQDNESLFVVGGGSSSAKSNLFTVSSSGVKSSVSIYENGTALTNKYAPKSHTHTITAGATDGIFDLTGTNGTNKVTYSLAPYSTQQSKASFDTSTTNPTRTDRLNYNGYLYATKMYSDGYYEGGTSLSNKYVPQTRTINSKTLNNNITLTSEDITHFGFLSNINDTDDCTLSETLGNLDTWISKIDTNHTHEIYVNMNECSTLAGTEELLDEAFLIVDEELGNVQTQLDNKAPKTHVHSNLASSMTIAESSGSPQSYYMEIVQGGIYLLKALFCFDEDVYAYRSFIVHLQNNSENIPVELYDANNNSSGSGVLCISQYEEETFEIVFIGHGDSTLVGISYTLLCEAYED